jgi:sugar lactone lactonase YvrE
LAAVAAVAATAAVSATMLAASASGRTPAPAEELAAPPAAVAAGAAGEAELRTLGARASFRTTFGTPLGIEGLTGDSAGNVYAAGRGGDPLCPVWRARAAGGPAEVVGNIPAPCSPTGLTFDARGRLFVADGADIFVVTPDPAAPPTGTVFASNLPGANGLAFDRRGNLWVSDGGTGQGRVWRVRPDGRPEVAFRVQPMVNDVNVTDGVGGVGRDPRSLPPGKVSITPDGRAAADTAGSQHLVANGLAFNRDGTELFVADTARGAIWKVDFDRRGDLRSRTGCDTTFAPDTLCLDNVWVTHPYLDGADGIALDLAGNVWVAANERNAIAVVTPDRRTLEFFRSPVVPATQLRNNGPLEFPTSPFLVGRTLCVTSSDGSRRDNAPNTGGEATPAGAVRATISCLDQRLPVAGLPLPVR